LRLVADVPLRARLAAAGPDYARCFDADVIARDFLATLAR
ncbi:glycosyltransferase family 1 protein, partial [Acidithiobacillus ferriphilus]|nr:glycosyltransferase family 1 protein [Acidithiobacillus ferriphilus]